MNKYIMIESHKGILCSNENKLTIGTCDNIDGKNGNRKL